LSNRHRASLILLTEAMWTALVVLAPPYRASSFVQMPADASPPPIKVGRVMR